MKKGKSKRKGSARNFYLLMVAALTLVLSLGLSYGYALHLSDLTGVTEPGAGGYEENSGRLDSGTGQGEPVMPGTRAHLQVWGKENSDRLDSRQSGQAMSGARAHIVVWGR